MRDNTYCNDVFVCLMCVRGIIRYYTLKFRGQFWVCRSILLVRCLMVNTIVYQLIRALCILEFSSDTKLTDFIKVYRKRLTGVSELACV